MINTASQMTIEQRKQAVAHLQMRLVRSLLLYGMLLTAAAAMVASIYSPGIDMPPRRLIASSAVFFVTGGCLFTLIFLLPVLRWIGNRAEESRILPIWLGIGLAFGIFTVFLIGASKPFAIAVLNNIIDFRSVGTLIDNLIDAFLFAPLESFKYGVIALYIGIIAGIIYGIGGWLIDMLNRMNYQHAYSDPWIEGIGDILPFTRRWASASAPVLSAIGPWAIALIAGGIILLFAATGPIEFLAKFRLG